MELNGDKDEVPVEGVDEAGDWTQRIALVFLIDARKPMFSGQDSYFKKCIECIRSVMLNIGRKRMGNFLTSIVLFGTEKSSGTNLPNNVAEFQRLGYVTAQRIVQLGDLLISDFKKIIEDYGHSDKFSIASALHYSQVVISKWKGKLYNKGIIMFTYDDDPHVDNMVEAHKARKQALDLNQLNIDLDLVPFGEFDSNRFYKELIINAKGEDRDDWTKVEPLSNLKDITQEIEGSYGKHSYSIRKFWLGKDRAILVALSSLFVEPTKQTINESKQSGEEEDKAILLEKGPPQQPSNLDNNDWIPQMTTDMSEEGSSSDKSSFKFNMPLPAKFETFPYLGGKVIPINKVELAFKSIKTEVGFKLLGFVPSKYIPEHYNVGKTYLMLPHSKDSDGARLWAYLLKRCSERGLSMLAWYMYHKGCEPNLVAMSPNLHLRLVTSGQYPPGFIVAQLPFEDDLMEYNEEPDNLVGEATEEQKLAAEKIVQKLSFKYRPDMFHDYDHRRYIAMLEALALKYDKVEEFEDDTDVDKAEISERLGDLSKQFVGSDNSYECSSTSEVTSGDRSYASKPRPPKAIKRDFSEITSMVKEQKAHKLTVAQLRELLQYNGVKSLSTMNKDRLISIAYDLVNRQSQSQ